MHMYKPFILLFPEQQHVQITKFSCVRFCLSNASYGRSNFRRGEAFFDRPPPIDVSFLLHTSSLRDCPINLYRVSSSVLFFSTIYRRILKVTLESRFTNSSHIMPLVELTHARIARTRVLSTIDCSVSSPYFSIARSAPLPSLYLDVLKCTPQLIPWISYFFKWRASLCR